MYCSQCGVELMEKCVEGWSYMVCPDCGTIVRRQLAVGVGVLVQRDRELLLVREGSTNSACPGGWTLPAGPCRSDEPPLVMVARQVSQVTGLQVNVAELVDVYYFDDKSRGNGMLLVYEADLVDGDLQSDGVEATGVGFFAVDQLPEPLCGGGHDQAILAWRAHVLDRWQPGMPMQYCPHCKHPLEIREAFDRLRSVCPVCGFVGFRTPKVGVSLLVEEGHRVLLVRRGVEPGAGMWSLPSGFVEWDESPEAAAVRECAEETGLLVAVAELLSVRQYTDDYRGPGINLTYRVQVTGGNLQPGDDAVEARFFAPDELPTEQAIAFRGHRLVLRQWLEAREHNARWLESDSADDPAL
ncbi:MAG: NUDIX domain-containing protein [Anaerolineae bacterium]